LAREHYGPEMCARLTLAADRWMGDKENSGLPRSDMLANRALDLWRQHLVTLDDPPAIGWRRHAAGSHRV
jgi:hypothetical protein